MNALRCQILIVSLTLILSHATGQPVVDELEKYLSQVKVNSAARIPSELFHNVKDEKVLLQTLIRHASDPSEQFQFRIIDLIRLIGLKSKVQDTRSLAVNQIVNTVAHKNLRISGFASHAVSNFLKTDFSKVNGDSILSYLHSGMPNLDILIRLAGYLELPAAKERVASLLSQPVGPTIKWNARLALVRLGDEEQTNYILEKIGTATIDDAFVYSLIPGLVYTRNPKIFRQLERILQSDEYVCNSSHPDSQKKILCAYRVLEGVAGAIDKFPLKVDDSGDLLVDNYQSALQTAREWFKQNPEYKLNRQTM